MLSIGHFAKLAKVSPRTVRFYESIGLIKSSSRGDNNYRYYDQLLLERVAKIRDLQELGFSLEEIKNIFKISNGNFTQNLLQKLTEVDDEIETLRERRTKLKALLSVSQKIDSKESINDIERKQYMEAIHEEILAHLKLKHGELSEAQLNYLKRDRSFETPEQQEFIEALKKCMDFAKVNNLRLGPGRGSSASSIVLYALGVSDFDPTKQGLFPERLLTQAPNIHIDVEFERGQKFVDFCKMVTSQLRYGQIQAFKMPLLDIIKNVDERLGKKIDYRTIDENSEIVLGPIRSGDIEKIFHFDMSLDSLIMKFENHLPEYAATQNKKMIEYLGAQKIFNFRDVSNITALWRPFSETMVERLERYRLAKEKPLVYECLAPELQESLIPNFGMIIYHEDILRILAHYTKWDLERCNRLRRDLFFDLKPGRVIDDVADLHEFRKMAPTEVVELFLRENPNSFCMPHTFSFSKFTKMTAILKSLHKDIYFEEIEKWEKKNGFRWDDIGVNFKGVSLLQN